MVAAINKQGLNFEALDGTSTGIVILLLTPNDNNELQLKLLSQIASKFRDKSRALDYLSVSAPEEFIRMIREK